jgi:CelD/BcsL family acetyltransferase involved in cellulose biosynthesis
MTTGTATPQTVPFRYRLSDWTLFSVQRSLLVRGFGLDEAREAPPPSAHMLPEGCGGLMLRSIPLPEGGRPGIVVQSDGNGRRLLHYVLQLFPRYYIDMDQSWDDYKKKFSSKTRSTLARKIKKFTDHCGGALRWQRFTRADELDHFWALAGQVSARTYQERLLDAGLPTSPAYIVEAKRLADADELRAFLLFDGERPVSYLFCPVRDAIVDYAYLGYDPDYLRLSVGTVLQWLALESLFAERRFRFFDFTEGESEHKRLFATGRTNCANVALLPPTLANRLLAHSHYGFNCAAEALGRWLQKHGLKTRVRHWLRFGRSAAS